MLNYKEWLELKDNIKDKYAIDYESKYETFYITGEDLEEAFNAGKRYGEYNGKE